MPSAAASNAASLVVDIAVIAAVGAAALVGRLALRVPGVYGRRRHQLTDWWGRAICAFTIFAMFLWVIIFA